MGCCFWRGLVRRGSWGALVIFFFGGGAGEKVHTFGCQKAEERIWQLGERVLFLGIKVTQTPCGDL